MSSDRRTHSLRVLVRHAAVIMGLLTLAVASVNAQAGGQVALSLTRATRNAKGLITEAEVLDGQKPVRSRFSSQAAYNRAVRDWNLMSKAKLEELEAAMRVLDRLEDEKLVVGVMCPMPRPSSVTSMFSSVP